MFKFLLSIRLRNSLWGSDILMFLEFINIVSILFYNLNEFIIYYILLYTSLVISFSQYKENTIWQISFGDFPEVLPAFTSASAISNLLRLCLGVNILSNFLFKNLTVGDFGYSSYPS